MTKWRHELRWMRWAIARGDHDMRLDRWLRQQFPTVPQSLLQTQLRKRKIRILSSSTPSRHGTDNDVGSAPELDATQGAVSALPTRANSLLREGLTVAIDAHVFHTKLLQRQQEEHSTRSAKRTQPRYTLPLLPELLARIVHQDSNYLVLDKPAGLAVQDGTGLESSLADYLPAIAQAAGQPAHSTDAAAACRLVHRLDKETSGLLVLARSRLAAATFTALLQEQQVLKTYRALVSAPSAAQRHALETRIALLAGEIVSPVDGKPSTTLVRAVVAPSRPDPRGVWLELSPITGRKHQLRVHCAHVLGAPIVGDTKYCGPRAERLLLHAHRIEFPDPFAAASKSAESSVRDVGQSRYRGSAVAEPSRRTEAIVCERSIDHVYAGHR